MSYFGEPTSDIGASPRVAATLYSAAMPVFAPPTATATPPLLQHHPSIWDESVDIQIPDVALFVLAAAFLMGGGK